MIVCVIYMSHHDFCNIIFFAKYHMILIHSLWIQKYEMLKAHNLDMHHFQISAKYKRSCGYQKWDITNAIVICIPAPKWALQFAKTKNFGSISFTTVIIKDGRLAIGHMSFWEQALKKSDTQFSLRLHKIYYSNF